MLERNKQQKEKLLQSQPKLSSLSSSSSSHNLLSGAANKRPHGSTAHGAVDSSSAKVSAEILTWKKKGGGEATSQHCFGDG